MELTKKELEQILDSKLDKQTKVLSEQIDELARMTKNGFDDVIKRLDVRERVDKLEKQMKELRAALNLT